MNGLQRIWIVFSKEVRDNLRDRRSVFSALGSSLIGPIILLVVIILVGKSIFQDIQSSSMELAVAGAQHAPNLIQFLEQNGVEIQEPPADPEEAVRNGDLDMVLIIPEDYGEDFSAGRPATVQVVLDSSRQSSSGFLQRARRLIEAYESQIGAMRLLARGISPEITRPLAVEQVDVATPQSQAVIFLNMMPYFIVLVVFVGGMYVIIDTTAGERERGSLEPLLINPVTRAEFVLGKLGAALPFAIFAVFATLLAFYLAFNLVPLEDYIGFQLTLSGPALAGIFLLSLPMVLLASALQMIIVTFTRSFKEAQTYVSFLPLIPALPGIGLAFLPVKASLWTMLIPTFGQQLLINQLMRGEPVSTMNVLVSTLVTVALAIVLILLAIRMYSQEKVLFGSTTS
jgi:sodium transport system permease protein